MDFQLYLPCFMRLIQNMLRIFWIRRIKHGLVEPEIRTSGFHHEHKNHTLAEPESLTSGARITPGCLATAASPSIAP